MDFTVRYEPTPEEVARALGQGLKQQLNITLWVLPGVLIVSGLVCISLAATSVGIGMLAGAVIFPLAWTWSIRRTGKRRLAYLCVPTTLRITDEGYECRTDQSTTTVQWSLFGRIVTGTEFWLFFVGRQFTGFLPRQAFSTQQQAELDALIASQQRTGAT